MRAIAHPLRLKILCVLGEHELSVQDIVEAVGTSQSNVSQHLAILREKTHPQYEKKRQSRVLFRERPAYAASYRYHARSAVRQSSEIVTWRKSTS